MVRWWEGAWARLTQDLVVEAGEGCAAAGYAVGIEPYGCGVGAIHAEGWVAHVHDCRLVDFESRPLLGYRRCGVILSEVDGLRGRQRE